MCKMNILKALGIAVSLSHVCCWCPYESCPEIFLSPGHSNSLLLHVGVNRLFVLLQLNADCLDDLPLDYDLALGGVGGVGGVGALALEAVVSGASSDGTLSEGGSSVVLDPGVRRVGLPQDYQDPDTLRDSPVTATTDTHTGNAPHTVQRLWCTGRGQEPGNVEILLCLPGELQPMASSASVASFVIAVETGLSDEEGSMDQTHLGDKS